MSSTIRLYRRFYKLNSSGNNDTHELIDPAEVLCNSYVKDSVNVIETKSPTKESLGIYFVDLNPNFYSFSNIYDLIWEVRYINNSNIKKLYTTFKINPINISANMDYEIEKNEIIYNVNNEMFEIIILNQ